MNPGLIWTGKKNSDVFIRIMKAGNLYDYNPGPSQRWRYSYNP
jgi:hypothetical protein